MAVVPLEPKTKKPYVNDWQSTTFAADVVVRAEIVGGKLGEPSNGSVDVDLDDPSAVRIASAFLPSTPAVFGRPSVGPAHRLYRVLDLGDFTRQQYKDPDDGKLLFELRANKHQTMLPGSIHPSGEAVEWIKRGPVVGGQPAEALLADLLRRLGWAAAATYLLRNYATWASGHHDLWLDVGGMFARAKVQQQMAESFTRAVCIYATDGETDGRVRSVRETYRKHAEGEPITGLQALRDRIGDSGAIFLRDNLGCRLLADGGNLHDVGNGKRFIDQHGDNVRNAVGLGPMVWTGTHWGRDLAGQWTEFAKATAAKIYDEAKGLAEDDAKAVLAHAKTSHSAARIGAMVDLASSDPEIVVRESDFDTARWEFNVQNGTVNLRTSGLGPHERHYLSTAVSPVTHDRFAICPRWDKFLERALPDPAVRAYVQRIVGYSLTGLATEKMVPIFFGPPDTGKTTFVETLQELHGEEYCKVVGEATIAAKKGSDGIPNDVARLRNARLVTVSETTEGMPLNAARIKAMTGRNRQVARFMRGEFFEFTPSFLMLIETNHRPVVQDSDDALWGRVKLIEFGVQIPESEQDGDLPAALANEMPGILNWAVAGCLAWQSEKLVDPPQVVAATQRYRDESSPLEDFVEERCDLGRDVKVLQATLYAAYKAWAGDNGVREPLSKTDFRARIVALPGVMAATGTGNKAIFTGITSTAVAEVIRPPEFTRGGLDPFAAWQGGVS